MACYRSGGCGPYEMLSCSECPASKPEYLKKDACAVQTEETTGLTDFLGNEIQVGDFCVFLKNTRTGSSTCRKVPFKGTVTGSSACKIRFDRLLVYGEDIIDLDAWERMKNEG